MYLKFNELEVTRNHRLQTTDTSRQFVLQNKYSLTFNNEHNTQNNQHLATVNPPELSILKKYVLVLLSKKWYMKIRRSGSNIMALQHIFLFSKDVFPHAKLYSGDCGPLNTRTMPQRMSKFEKRMHLMRQNRLFKPLTVPRYLPGSAPAAVIQTDLNTYNRHRFHCFYAEPVVDDRPPEMNPYSYVNRSRLRADASRLQEIDQHNKQLLRKINYINLMGGRIDSFNKNAYDTTSNWKANRNKMLKICRSNIELYRRLISTSSNYPLSYFEREWEKNMAKMKHMAKYTLQMLLTKTIDQQIKEMPSITGDLLLHSKVVRPQCFMEFRIKDGIPLGRIIMELYIDVVPETCKNFLYLCNGTQGLQYKNCKIYNVLRGHYLETGDVTSNNGKGGCSIFGEKFLAEEFLLKHTKPGVLSMTPVDKIYNNSKFGITFCAQENLDKKRVVFGRVIKGMKTIFHIQDLSRKVGAPIAPIIITKCGELKKSKN